MCSLWVQFKDIAFKFCSDEDKHKGEKKPKRRVRKLSSSKPDENEIQESAVWKTICSQKTKLLVCFSLCCFPAAQYKLQMFNHMNIHMLCHDLKVCLFSAELFCKKFLQHEIVGSVSYLCHQFYSSVLQGEYWFPCLKTTLIFLVRLVCFDVFRPLGLRNQLK